MFLLKVERFQCFLLENFKGIYFAEQLLVAAAEPIIVFSILKM